MEPLAKALSRQLNQLFDDSDLDSFCLIYFSEVHDKFGRGMGKNEKIRLLLDYSYHRPKPFQELLKTLLKEFSNKPEFFKQLQQLQTDVDNGTLFIPPPQSPYHASGPPLQRPRRAEHFTGRKKELSRLLDDLQPGKVVTLCGPGGIGKSALAAEAIWTLAPDTEPPDRFPDGIIWHNFYNQSQVAIAFETIALVFGEEPRPTPVAAAQRVLANRRVLLLLDGTEQADNLPALLDITGNCGVLITSRNRKDAPAGRQDVTSLSTKEAMRLLQDWRITRTREMERDAVRQICELVGGLPLAIRLIGHYLNITEEKLSDYLAWLIETPLQALDFGKRQKESIPLLMERSLAQVSEEAKQVLGVISLLSLAPFKREVVMATLTTDSKRSFPKIIEWVLNRYFIEQRIDIRHVLGELVSYGLLFGEDGRYEVSHALIHTYAQYQIATPDEMVRFLATYYITLVKEQNALGPTGYAQLDPELGHLMAVLHWCVEREDWKAAQALAWAVDDYLDLQGHWKERLTALGAGLAAAQALGDQKSEENALSRIGSVYCTLGQVEQAVEYLQQALAIAREIGDREGEGSWLGNLGTAFSALGQVDQAIDYYQQALAISREIGNRRHEGIALGNLGTAYHNLGQMDQAIDYYQQALAISREIGNRRHEGTDLGDLGTAYHDLGQMDQAIDYFQQALAITREIGHRRNEGFWLGNLGAAYHDLGQMDQAIDYYQQALAISRETGHRRSEGAELGNLGIAYGDLGQMEQATDYLRQALLISGEIGNRQFEGTALGYLGTAYRSLGQVEQAIDFYQQALVIAQELDDQEVEVVILGRLAGIYRERGEVAQHRAYREKMILPLSTIIEHQPDNADIWHRRGWICCEIEEYERALADFNQCLQLDPDHDTAHYDVACIYARRNQVEEMLLSLRRALELDAAKWLARIPEDKDLDGVRDDPRFQALLAEFAEE